MDFFWKMRRLITDKCIYIFITLLTDSSIKFIFQNHLNQIILLLEVLVDWEEQRRSGN